MSLLEVGQAIEARFGGASQWHAGKVSKRNVDGSLSIAYNDGDHEDYVPRFRVRVGGQKQRKILEVGTVCDARFEGHQKLFRAVVTVAHLDGSFDLQYDDGDTETHVSRAMIIALHFLVDCVEAEAAATRGAEPAVAEAEVAARSGGAVEVSRKQKKRLKEKLKKKGGNGAGGVHEPKDGRQQEEGPSYGDPFRSPDAPRATPLRSSDAPHATPHLESGAVVRLMRTEGGFATLGRFDTSTERWSATLVFGGDGGERNSAAPPLTDALTLRLREGECSFAYHIRAGAVNGTLINGSAPCIVADTRIGGGRKLEATREYEPGDVAFADFPSLVVANEPELRVTLRWTAFRDLKQRASPPRTSAPDAGAVLLLDVLERMPFRASSSSDAGGGQNQNRAVAVMEEMRGVSERFDANAYECDRRGNVAADELGTCVAIYAYTALMNHSCAPSAFIEAAKSPDGQARMHTRAFTQVHAGEELTINYAPTRITSTTGLNERRRYLRTTYDFQCACVRCRSEEKGHLQCQR
jgi:hypothetical protein